MEENKRPQYKDKSQLLNKCEQQLFSKLREAAPKLVILSQVSMSQLFDITGAKGFLQVGEIGRKSVDFLICREDTSIMLAIELNGPMHDKASQKIGDKKKKDALEEAGIPLIIIKPDAIPDVGSLRKILAEHIVARTKHEATKNGTTPLKPNAHATKPLKAEEPLQKYGVVIGNTSNSCKHCGGNNLEVNFARSYYFRCLECNKNTAIKVLCPTCNRSEKTRKQKNNFFTECAHCNTSKLFHSNA
ncbi:MAG: DUF2726 domain-containing protein [Gallionella sp.]|nr:DUF2726 domain-containing protein [Gallionella sp.]